MFKNAFARAVWETSSGRCLRTLRLAEGVARVAWSPAGGLSLVAAAAGARLLLLNPGAGVGAHRVAARTDALLHEPPPAHDVQGTVLYDLYYELIVFREQFYIGNLHRY